MNLWKICIIEYDANPNIEYMNDYNNIFKGL